MSDRASEKTFGTIHAALGRWCLGVLEKDLDQISPQEIDKILKFLKDNAITGTREGVLGEIESKLSVKFQAPSLPNLDEELDEFGAA